MYFKAYQLIQVWIILKTKTCTCVSSQEPMYDFRYHVIVDPLIFRCHVWFFPLHSMLLLVNPGAHAYQRMLNQPGQTVDTGTIPLVAYHGILDGIPPKVTFIFTRLGLLYITWGFFMVRSSFNVTQPDHSFKCSTYPTSLKFCRCWINSTRLPTALEVDVKLISLSSSRLWRTRNILTITY